MLRDQKREGSCHDDPPAAEGKGWGVQDASRGLQPAGDALAPGGGGRAWPWQG